MGCTSPRRRDSIPASRLLRRWCLAGREAARRARSRAKAHLAMKRCLQVPNRRAEQSMRARRLRCNLPLGCRSEKLTLCSSEGVEVGQRQAWLTVIEGLIVGELVHQYPDNPGVGVLYRPTSAVEGCLLPRLMAKAIKSKAWEENQQSESGDAVDDADGCGALREETLPHPQRDKKHNGDQRPGDSREHARPPPI